MTIRVTIWNEYLHEKNNPEAIKIYPEGIHETLKKHLSSEKDFIIRTATLEQPEHGLTEEVLENTDVLIWWGHMAHGKVQDEVVQRVADRVRRGMGAILLHSSHASKLMKALTGC